MSLLPLMVEGAVDGVIDLLRAGLNNRIDLVAEEIDDPTINLAHVNQNAYYIAEGVEPLQPPAIFVIAERTALDLRFQNSVFQRHYVLVGCVVEDLGTVQLTRKAWRYAQALHACLHDQGTAAFRFLVREVDYGPILIPRNMSTGGTRQFRRDTTLRCEVLHAEA